MASPWFDRLWSVETRVLTLPFTSYVAWGKTNSLNFSHLICKLGIIALDGPYLMGLS